MSPSTQIYTNIGHGYPVPNPSDSHWPKPPKHRRCNFHIVFYCCWKGSSIAQLVFLILRHCLLIYDPSIFLGSNLKYTDQMTYLVVDKCSFILLKKISTNFYFSFLFLFFILISMPNGYFSWFDTVEWKVSSYSWRVV